MQYLFVQQNVGEAEGSYCFSFICVKCMKKMIYRIYRLLYPVYSVVIILLLFTEFINC